MKYLHSLQVKTSKKKFSSERSCLPLYSLHPTHLSIIGSYIHWFFTYPFELSFCKNKEIYTYMFSFLLSYMKEHTIHTYIYI